MIKLLKTRELMQMLGIGRTTIYRWMDAGKFPVPIKIGDRGDNRWRQSDIDAWADAQPEKSQTNAQLTIDAELNGTARNGPGR